jgi:hypothetical protein
VFGSEGTGCQTLACVLAVMLLRGCRITANGPAIWGGCVTRRKHRVGSWYFSQRAVTVQGGYGTCFCRHGTNFIACWRDRGISLIGAANLSPVTKLVAGTGAVSRYKLSRSQKTVTMQDLNCWQMRVPALTLRSKCHWSGCKNHYQSVMGAGTKAKTVTNNLPILSVLAFRFVYSFYQDTIHVQVDLSRLNLY